MLGLLGARRDRQGIWLRAARASIGLIVSVTLLAHAQTSAAPDRVALVIGNAAYKDAPLLNTRSDATEMAELLKAAGFTVELRIDASLESFRGAVTRFGEQVKSPTVKFGMFYYAGHGLQLNSRNYLIPVNANLKSSEDVPRQGVDVTDLLRYMEQVNDKSLIVILDACRDDPFSSTYRTGSKGLSPYNAPAGTLLAYATGPGQVALDGTGKNGLYTKYLLRELAIPGESLLDGFMRVRIGVMTESRGRQIPWELSSLIDRDLYLFPGERKRKPDLADRVRQDDDESAAWRQIKSGSSALEANEIARFLRIYPNGITAEQAQHLLRRLWAQNIRQDADADRQVTAKAPVDPRRDDSAAQARAEADAAGAAIRAQAARMEAERQEAARREAAALAADRLQQQRLAEQRAVEQELLAQAVAARREAERRDAERIGQERAEVRAREEAQARAAEQRALELRAQAERARREEAVRLAAAEAKAATAELARVNDEIRRAEAARVAEVRQAEAARLAAAAKSTVAAASISELEPIRVAPTAYFQGFDEHVRNYRVGDEFEFRIVDNLTRLTTGTRRMQVTAVQADRDRVEYNNGEFLSDLMGNTVRNQLGEFDAVRQFYPANLFVGKQWRTHFKQSRPNGIVYTFRYDLKVVGKERVTVPAGTFDTYKIEARGFNMELNATLQRNIWVAPGVNADIVLETMVRLRNGTIEQHDRQELVRYAVPGRPVAGR